MVSPMRGLIWNIGQDTFHAKFLKSYCQIEFSCYNVGVNVGEVAGQTIMHCHMHLIPRRKNDVEDPVGGVRNTIPGKGNYRKSRT